MDKISLLKEQKKREGKIDEIVSFVESNVMSKSEAENLIIEILEGGEKNHIFSRKDIEKLEIRRDRENPRSNIDFFIDLRRRQGKEKSIILYLCNWLRGGGAKVRYEPFGSDIEGKIIIGSFSERATCSDPDYTLWINEKERKVEIKSFCGEHWFKIPNLRSYKKYSAYIFIESRGSYYLYSMKSSAYLLKEEANAKKRYGKNCIIVDKNKKNANYTFEELINKEVIKMLPERT